MSLEYDAMLRGERPIHKDDNGHQPLCSILQHEHVFFRQLESKQNIEITDLDGLEKLHHYSDVIFFDSLCRLANPSEAYKSYIDHIKHPGWKYEYNPKKLGYDHVSPIDEMTKAEIVGYNAVRCNEGKNIVYYPKYEAGEYSPYSKAVSVRSSANRLASQLCKLPEASGINDLYLMGWDMTFPHEISQIALKDQNKALQIVDIAVKSFIKQLIKQTNWIRKDGFRLGYFSNTHIWHSHHSGDMKEISTPHEPHLHAHINFVNMVERGTTAKDAEYVRFNPNVKREIVQECWSYAIFKASGCMAKEPVFYLHYIDLNSRARIAHRIRYCGRSPLNDLFDYYQDNDFNENIPREYNEFLVEYDNRRHTYGFIRNITALVGEIEGDKICPICASPAERLEPLSVKEMQDRVIEECIPVAVYNVGNRTVTVIKRESGDMITNPDAPEYVSKRKYEHEKIEKYKEIDYIRFERVK